MWSLDRLLSHADWTNRASNTHGYSGWWHIPLAHSSLALLPNESQSIVTAVAEDNLLNSYPLTVEFVGKVPGIGRLAQIVLKLPSNLPPAQEVRVSVSLRGKTSNKVRLRIK